MNLFVDAVSNNWILIIFDAERNILEEKELSIKWNESSSLIPLIDGFLKNNNLEYRDLDNIVVVNWPGSFTGIRTIVLWINTINYIIKKSITPLNYFDLFNKYPIVKSSSKRDCFFKKSQDSEIEIIENNALLELLNNLYINEIYWEINNDFLQEIKILDKINYSNIIKSVEFKNNDKIQPLYIKKPNIS